MLKQDGERDENNPVAQHHVSIDTVSLLEIL